MKLARAVCSINQKPFDCIVLRWKLKSRMWFSQNLAQWNQNRLQSLNNCLLVIMVHYSDLPWVLQRFLSCSELMDNISIRSCKHILKGFLALSQAQTTRTRLHTHTGLKPWHFSPILVGVPFVYAQVHHGLAHFWRGRVRTFLEHLRCALLRLNPLHDVTQRAETLRLWHPQDYGFLWGEECISASAAGLCIRVQTSVFPAKAQWLTLEDGLFSTWELVSSVLLSSSTTDSLLDRCLLLSDDSMTILCVGSTVLSPSLVFVLSSKSVLFCMESCMEMFFSTMRSTLQMKTIYFHLAIIYPQ